jgi:NitT/TauT family transport system ATP-binding protein
MRQRVNLARALAVGPDVLLMDEPFAALDAQTRELMQAELLRIWSEERRNVVFITHQIEEAVYLADRVLVFSSRPSVVKAAFAIDLPRPRPLAAKRQAALLGYVDAIWRLIEEEVKA